MNNLLVLWIHLVVADIIAHKELFHNFNSNIQDDCTIDIIGTLTRASEFDI